MCLNCSDKYCPHIFSRGIVLPAAIFANSLAISDSVAHHITTQEHLYTLWHDELYQFGLFSVECQWERPVSSSERDVESNNNEVKHL